MYNVQWPEDQCLIFMNDDQGHDHLHEYSWQGRGEVGQGHVRVNGYVKDEGRGGDNQWFLMANAKIQ